MKITCELQAHFGWVKRFGRWLFNLRMFPILTGKIWANRWWTFRFWPWQNQLLNGISVRCGWTIFACPAHPWVDTCNSHPGVGHYNTSRVAWRSTSWCVGCCGTYRRLELWCLLKVGLLDIAKWSIVHWYNRMIQGAGITTIESKKIALEPFLQIACQTLPAVYFAAP